MIFATWTCASVEGRPGWVVTAVAAVGLVLAVTASSFATAFAHETTDVNANAFPWSSVGKIYNNARSSCTGSVIARDRVLTAAHCLYNRATKRFLQAESLHFLLGYKSGEYRAHALVATYSVGTSYDPDDANKSVLGDWAILTLTAAVASSRRRFNL